MKNPFILFLLSALLMVPSISQALSVGNKAPLFDAESIEWTISLESYRDKKNALLAFYYADFTRV